MELGNTKQHIHIKAAHVLGCRSRPVVKNQNSVNRMDATQISGSKNILFMGFSTDRSFCIDKKQTLRYSVLGFRIKKL